MEWREQITLYVDQINDALSVYTDAGDAENKLVVDAMQYSLFAGGKRLRPVLTLASAEMMGASARLALPYACAIEMIHTYSLIHDDLPAMDDDDLRRGKPTNHRVYGEGMAVLAGDGLLNLAYEIMLQDVLIQKEPKAFLLAMNEIAAAAGINGMIGGQTADLMNEGKQVTAETLGYIHRHKTGALLAASLTAGAYIAGADEASARKLNRAGHALGLAFQIQDDLLDLIGDEDIVGKSLGRDLEKGKLTLPVTHLVSQANPEDRGESLRVLTQRDAAALRDRLRHHGSMAYAQETARRFVREAKSELEPWPAGRAVRMLQRMADSVIDRTY